MNPHHAAPIAAAGVASTSEAPSTQPHGYYYDNLDDPYAGAFWSHFRQPHELAARHVPLDASPAATMKAYREYRDRVRKPVLATYTILGFLSSGTYGRVYKARLRSDPQLPPTSGSAAAGLAMPTASGAANVATATAKKRDGLLQQHQLLDSPSAASSLHPTPKSVIDLTAPANATPGRTRTDSPGVGAAAAAATTHTTTTTGGAAITRTADNSSATTALGGGDGQIFAIKKFKPDTKETDATVYTGISQSAMREISLNRELSHVNIVTLRQVMLEDKAIYMVFEYAEHDLLQIIHYHSTALRTPIPTAVLKSLMWQLVNGVAYLHANWILHRDLKPANILVTSNGVVKIGDLGLARLYSSPLQSLYNGDKVVVTIWYRAPELLLGARHYTTAIDMWSVGCIWGELLALRPMFKGEEAKMDPKTKAAPFQTDQLKRIVEVLGTPNKERWPAIESMPDYKGWWPHLRLDNYPKTLSRWYTSRHKSEDGYDLFDDLLQYDPEQRLTANQALAHGWFAHEPQVTLNAFASLAKPVGTYPNRRVIHDDLDPKMKSNYQPPIDAHHLPAIQQANLNSAHPIRLAQLLHRQHHLSQQGSGGEAGKASVGSTGPAAPPALGTVGMQTSAPSTAPSLQPNPPLITIAHPPSSTPTVRSTHSLQSGTDDSPAANSARSTLVATAARNNQRKRQRI
ncbi:hypothetical protein L1887_58064 [Cichorium endivia]|nr:hypothetical protein L1887_58064 [Cichorium endivia]